MSTVPSARPRPLHFAAFVMNTTGLMQREYTQGSLRHKLFGQGDRLPGRHPAARYRGAPHVLAPQTA
jgi:hypothetical protein